MKNIFSKRNKNLEILKKAQREGWAVGQFNISSFEALKAVFQAAKILESPVIIGTSEGESKYMGLRQVAALVRAFEKEFKVPAILNLDHAKTFDYIKEAISAGYDAVHFDGSKLSFKENIKITKEISDYARKNGVIIEGELGHIAGSSQMLQTEPEIREEDLTLPEEALFFVRETKVDNLAINVGTFHGVVASKNSEHINLARLREIKNETKNIACLVLHGGSGIPETEIKEAIKEGIVKININTELRLAFTNTLEGIFKEGPKDVVPYKYMPQVISAIQEIVQEKIKIFNSNNKI